jgi:hypothetical protein
MKYLKLVYILNYNVLAHVLVASRNIDGIVVRRPTKEAPIDAY